MVPDTEWSCVKCGPIREDDILETGRCSYCFNAVVGQEIPLEEDDPYEYDGQPDEMQEWYDFDPDC